MSVRNSERAISSKQIISYHIKFVSAIIALSMKKIKNIRLMMFPSLISVIPIKDLTWIELTATIAWGDDGEFLSPFPLLTWLQHNWGVYSTRIYTKHRCVILISHIRNTLGLLIPRVPQNCSYQRYHEHIRNKLHILLAQLDQGGKKTKSLRTCIWHAFLSQLNSSLSLMIYYGNLCRSVQVHSINL